MYKNYVQYIFEILINNQTISIASIKQEGIAIYDTLRATYGNDVKITNAPFDDEYGEQP